MTKMTFRIVVCTLAAIVVASGCSKKHENFPAPLGVSVPQKVMNLSVTNPQLFDYDLDWDIGDPSTVEYYRVYGSLDGFQFALVADSVTTTQPTISSPLPVAYFGVTVVSDEFVEGAMVTAPAP